MEIKRLFEMDDFPIPQLVLPLLSYTCNFSRKGLHQALLEGKFDLVSQTLPHQFQLVV